MKRRHSERATHRPLVKSRSRTAKLLLLAGSLLVAPAPGTTAASPPPSVRFIGGMWYDGEEFVARDVLYSVGGIFRADAPARVDRTVDLTDRYIVPPFGDAHHHNHTRERLLAFIDEGVFYVKNPANLPRELRSVRRFMNRPDRVDVRFAGGVFTAPGGHPIEIADRNIELGTWKESDGEGGFYWALADLDDLARKWAPFLQQPRDFVKTFLLYSEDYAVRRDDDDFYGLKGLDPVLLSPIVERAHASGLTVSTHVETVADFRNAVAAGVDEINHLPGFRADPQILHREGFRRYKLQLRDARDAARAGIAVVTTLGGLIEGIQTILEDPKTEQSTRRLALKVQRGTRRNLRALAKAGVRVLVGGDRFEETTLAEVRALAQLGVYDNAALLRMLSVVTPQAIFPDRRIGFLEEGYEASLLALEGNPLDDLSQLEHIEVRYKQGREIS